MSLKVGQKVVAIENFTLNDGTHVFKKGDTFTVLGVEYSPCCHTEIVDIGIITRIGHLYCNRCDYTEPKTREKHWVASKLLIPIQEDFQSISLTKILEKETPLIGVN